MFLNMKLNYSKILDIKCILAEVSKKKLANDLGISQMTLSREIKDKSIIESIEKYFNNIDPEINSMCYKLRSEDFLEIKEPEAKYIKSSELGITEKYIKHLETQIQEKDRQIMTLISGYPNKQTGSD